MGSSVALIGSAAHALAGGHPPSWAVVGLASAGASGVAWALAGRHLSAGRLLGLLSVAQILIHLLSNWVALHPAHHGLPMLGAHLLAAAASALLIARADRLWWHLYAWLTRSLRQLPTGLSPRPRLLVWTGRRTVCAPDLLTSVLRRGPPAPVQ